MRFALYPAGQAVLESRMPWLLETAGRGPWPPVQTSDNPALKTWTAPLPRTLEQQAGRSLTTTIPLHEPGLYLLTADSGAGPVDHAWSLRFGPGGGLRGEDAFDDAEVDRTILDLVGTMPGRRAP